MNSIKNKPRKIVGGWGQNSGHVYNLLQRGGLQCSSFLHEGWCQARLGMTHDCWL